MKKKKKKKKGKKVWTVIMGWVLLWWKQNEKWK